MNKEMIDECNMCHPQMKARTFATLQPNFMRNFQSKMPDLVGQPLMLPLLVAVCGSHAQIKHMERLMISIQFYPISIFLNSDYP